MAHRKLDQLPEYKTPRDYAEDQIADTMEWLGKVGENGLYVKRAHSDEVMRVVKELAFNLEDYYTTYHLSVEEAAELAAHGKITSRLILEQEQESPYLTPEYKKKLEQTFNEAFQPQQ